jgi:hypothetical protein
VQLTAFSQLRQTDGPLHSSVDELVGAVVETLHDIGAMDSTYIFFSSDHVGLQTLSLSCQCLPDTLAFVCDILTRLLCPGLSLPQPEARSWEVVRLPPCMSLERLG